MKNYINFLKEDYFYNDDIAIFNTKCIRIKQAKIQINDEWSEYMTLSEIEEKFNKWKDEEL